MDPYIERPAIWADFHGALIAEIRGVLQPLLRPKYAALMQDRLYVVQSERPIIPDIAVVRSRSPKRNGNGGVATLEADRPIVFELFEEEVRRPYLDIIEPAAGNRLITSIEVLSPDNKVPGLGRKNYMKKRREVKRARASFVEIDLLRAGKTTLQIDPADLDKARPLSA